MSKRKECFWGEIFELKYGKSLKNYNNDNGEYIVFGTNGAIGTTNNYLYDKESLIIGRKGAYRGVHYSNTPFFVIDTAYYTIPKTQDINIKFAYYQLKGIDINSLDSGTAIPSTTKDDFYFLPALIPSLTEQKNIASILSSLDSKIDLLRRQNQTLENIAQTLFKHWFVDFEFPDIDGKPYKSSGGKMVESELGDIPEGWEVEKLWNISETISKGTTPRKQDVEGRITDVLFLKVRDITDDGQIKLDSLEKIPHEIHNNALSRSKLEINDILFSIAGTIGRVAIVPKELDNSNCNQAVAFIRLSYKDIFLEYIHQWIKRPETQFEISSNIVQGVQANVSLTVLGNLQLIVPNDSAMNNWNNLIKPICYKIRSNTFQVQTLTKTRDTLLPKLMSGQIRVKSL